MLSRIQIRGFKSLADVEVDLGRLVVVLGPNASGKSNFLEALVLLSRIGRARTLIEAFEEGFRGYPHEAFTLPEGGVPGLLEGGPATLSIEADLECGNGGPSARHLRYRLAVRLDPATGALSVADEYMARLNRDWSVRKSTTPRLEAVISESGEKQLAVRRLSEGGQPLHEPLGLPFAQLANHQYSGARYADFDHLRRELEAWTIHALDPRQALREQQPPREVDGIGARGENLAAFLYRVQTLRPSHFKAIERALASIVPVEALSLELDRQRGVVDLGIVSAGVSYSSRVVSAGTLRALALSALAANPWPPRLLAYEEPENGVDPQRLATIAELIAEMSKRQQVIVTTHSPAFVAEIHALADEGVDLTLLRASRSGRFTTIEPFEVSLELFADRDIRAALRDD